MIKIDIISGFLGAGKTTLIKKFIKDVFACEKVVLIENEFGEIGVDSGFLKDAGIEIKEMNSGCICCSLVGDFEKSLLEVIETYKPERIIIEPSGVGKLSDIIKAIESINSDAGLVINSKIAVVNAKKSAMYIKNFGEFFINQIEHADAIALSRTDSMTEQEVVQVVDMLQKYNTQATISTTPWDQLDGKLMFDTMQNKNTLAESMLEEILHHEEEHECGCGHHHEEGHHHHEEEHECGCEHHHEEEHECGCGHHHADDVFTSWGIETPNKYSKLTLNSILESLQDEEKCGKILRAKGMVESSDGDWMYFDYVPGEIQIRQGIPCTIGKVCVIGAGINECNIASLFKK